MPARKTTTTGIRLLLGMFIIGLPGRDMAFGQSDTERIAELERKVELLTLQSEQAQFGEVFIPVTESEYGLGPSASKIYQKDQGLSIGGYGEGLYQVIEDGTDEADFLRAILYIGYKFNDNWILNTEFEFEHASTSEEGSVSVEFAYLDYLYTPALNFRAGLVLIPVGLVNELHEPTTFLGARRSDVESRIIPTTWRENGVGVFGELAELVQYKAFIVNGLEGEDFSGKGLRGGRQKGSEAKAEDLAGVIRVDLTPTPNVLVGASAYVGNSGQDLDVDVLTEIYEAHFDANWNGFSFRALGAVAQLDDVAELNRIIATAAAEDGLTPADSEIDSIGEELFGWYVELGYDVLNQVDAGEASLTPFVRFEQYNTQEKTPSGFKTSGKYDVDVVTIGVNFKPIDEIVFKADVQLYDDEGDEVGDQVNLAMGYVF